MKFFINGRATNFVKRAERTGAVTGWHMLILTVLIVLGGHFMAFC